MPARPQNAISGMLAGGIPGFGIVSFLLWHPTAHPCDVFVFLCCLLWMACSEYGTQAAISSPRFTAVQVDVFNIPLMAFLCGFGFLWLFAVVCFWLLLVCFGGAFCLVVFCLNHQGTHARHHTDFLVIVCT